MELCQRCRIVVDLMRRPLAVTRDASRSTQLHHARSSPRSAKDITRSPMMK